VELFLLLVLLLRILYNSYHHIGSVQVSETTGAVGVQGAFATSAWALFGVLCEDATWLDPGFPGLVPTHGSSEWCENAAGDLIKRMMTGPG